MTREVIPNSGTWEEDVRGRNRFWRAAWCGRMDILKLMTQYGEPQNFGQALKGAVEGVQRLRNSEMGLIGLRFQCEIVKQILPYMDKKEISKPYSPPTHDTDIDFATGETCLHLCVQAQEFISVHGSSDQNKLWLETFKMLMDHSEVKNLFNDDGRTVLHDAAASGLKDFVEVIMDAVDEKCPTTTGSEFTPLHLAAMGGQFEVCKLINERIPENKNMRDVDGKTPADLARESALA